MRARFTRYSVPERLSSPHVMPNQRRSPVRRRDCAREGGSGTTRPNHAAQDSTPIQSDMLGSVDEGKTMSRSSCLTILVGVLFALGGCDGGGDDDSAEGGDADEHTWSERLSTGRRHSCWLKEDASIVCWGYPEWGRLDAPATGSYVQVSAGSEHSCAVADDQSVVCWGNDGNGQSTVPSGAFVQVAAGEPDDAGYTCGLRTDGTAECWGSWNEEAEQLLLHPPSSQFTQISAGNRHVCGVRSDRTLECWGFNDDGEASPPSGEFLAVEAGEYFTCAIQLDGHVTCWGATERDSDWDTIPSDEFVQISAGESHACGVMTNEAIQCWGEDNDGETQPPAGTFQHVTCGVEHSCGLTTEETVLCWGSPEYDQTTPS